MLFYFIYFFFGIIFLSEVQSVNLHTENSAEAKGTSDWSIMGLAKAVYVAPRVRSFGGMVRAVSLLL